MTDPGQERQLHEILRVAPDFHAELKLLRVKLRLHALGGFDCELRLPRRLIEAMHIEHQLTAARDVLHWNRAEKRLRGSIRRCKKE